MEHDSRPGLRRNPAVDHTGHADVSFLTFFLYAYNPISVLLTRGVIMRRLGDEQPTGREACGVMGRRFTP